MSVVFFFFKQKTAYEIMPSLVGSEMCIRDSLHPTAPSKEAFENGNDRPAAHHRPKGKNNKMGFGIVGKVGTTSADSQVHKADSTAEPIRHGQTAGTPQGIYGENTVAY